MAKRCPSCGMSNGDDRLFCAGCGGPLDGDLKLLMDLEKRDKGPAQHRTARHETDDDDYVPPVPQEEKHSVLPWIILVATIVVAGVVWFFLS